MGPGEHRPHDEQYWISPWSTALFAGDLFEEESVACLFRPSLVSDELLAEPPRRVAQLQPEARRHLKAKLAAYWARIAVDVKELPLQERGEEELRADAWPPSRYDGDVYKVSR